MSNISRATVIKYVIAAAVSALALAVTVTSPLVVGAPFLLLAVAIMVICWYGGVGPGILAAVIAASGAFYGVLPHHGFLSLAGPDDWLRFGVFLLVAVLIIGITAQREQARKSLQQSEERLRTSFESLLDALAILHAVRDESGQIVDFVYEYVNEAACQLNRMPREAVLGKRLLEVLPAHQESGLFAEYCHVVQTGEPLAKESLTYEDVFGKQRLSRAFDIRASKLGDGFVVSWRDVTERARADEKLKESEVRYRRIIETATEGVWTLDAENRTTYVNPRGAQILGAGPDALLGSSPVEFMFPEDLVRGSERLELLRQGTGARYNGRLRARDGAERWVSVSTAPILGAAGEYVGALAMVADVTARHHAEARLRDLTQHMILLQEQERRYLSHELHDEVGQVLAAVKLRLEMIQSDLSDLSPDRFPERKELDQVVVQMTSALARIQYLAQGLRPPSLDTTGLDATLEGLCRSLEREAGLPIHYSNAEVGQEVPDALCIFLYRFLQEALTNVQLHAHAKEVRVTLLKETGGIALAVEDDGQGFDVEKAFAWNDGGKSLGLLRMREWLKFLGGSLEIESEPGRGTRLVARLPV